MISNDLSIYTNLAETSAPNSIPSSLPLPATPEVEGAAALDNRSIVQETLPSVNELIWADRLEEAALRLKHAQTAKEKCRLGSLYIFLSEYEEAAKILHSSLLEDGENLETWFWFFQVQHLIPTFSCPTQHMLKLGRVDLAKNSIGGVERKNLGFVLYWKRFVEMKSISLEEAQEIIKIGQTPYEGFLICCLCRNEGFPLIGCSLPPLLERYVFEDLCLSHIHNPKPLIEYLLFRHRVHPQDSFPLMGLAFFLSPEPTEGKIWLEKLQQLCPESLVCETLNKLYNAQDADYKYASINLISCKTDIIKHVVYINHQSLGDFDAVQDQKLLSKLILQAKRITPLSPEVAFFEGLYLKALNDPNCMSSFLHAANTFQDEGRKAQAYYHLGLEYCVQNDATNSKNCFLKALPFIKNPLQCSDAEIVLSSIYFSSGDFETARKYAANACNHNPKNYKGFFTLSGCYDALKQYKEAEKWMLKAIRLATPEEIAERSLYYLLIELLIRNKKEIEAHQYIEKYKATNPSRISIKRLEAHYAVAFGDKKEAIKALEEVVSAEKRYEDDIDLYLNLLMEEKQYLQVKSFIYAIGELSLKDVQYSLTAAFHLSDAAWMAELGQLKAPGLDKLPLMPLARAEYYFAKNDVKLAIRFIKELLPSYPDLIVRLQEFEKALPKPPDTPPLALSLSTPLEKDEAFKKLQREEQLRRKESKKSKEVIKPVEPPKKEKKERTNLKTAAVYASQRSAAAAAAACGVLPPSPLPSEPPKPFSIEIVRKAPIAVPCYLDPKLTSPIDKPMRKLLLHAKKAFVAMCDTFKRADLDDEVRLMALLHYQFQIWEALMHVPGFSSVNALRQAIRHESASITLADLSHHIEEMKNSPFESCLKQLLEEGQSLQTFSLSKYKEASPLTVDELWAAVKSRLALLTPIYQGLSRLVKEKGRDEIHINDLHLEGDITAALQGIYLVLGEAFSRLVEAHAIPPQLRSNPLFKKIITHGNTLAHEQKKTPFPLVPENELFNLLLEGPKLL